MKNTKMIMIIKFKKPSDLNENELELLIKHYNEMDFTELYKKNRKGYIEKLRELENEQEKRNKEKNYG